MAKDTVENKDTGVPKNDAYTGMLVISLLALIGGSVLLYLDKSQYPDNPPNFTVPAFTPPAKVEKGPEAAKKEGEPNPPGQVQPMPEPKAGKQ